MRFASKLVTVVGAQCQTAVLMGVSADSDGDRGLVEVVKIPESWFLRASDPISWRRWLSLNHLSLPSNFWFNDGLEECGTMSGPKLGVNQLIRRLCSLSGVRSIRVLANLYERLCSIWRLVLSQRPNDALQTSTNANKEFRPVMAYPLLANQHL